MDKMEKVYDWWESLTEEKQYEIIIDWYSMEIEEDTDIDKFFGDMPNDKKLEIYDKEVK